MKISKAREIAATAWCDKRTSDREMDVELAEVFAEILCEIYTQGRADQNEADVKVVKGYTKVHPLSWQYTPSALAAAIRAAGPEVGE